MFQHTIICLIFFLLHCVCAVPLIRTVIDPPITFPKIGTVWKVGQRQTVTWDTSVIPKDPKDITNPNGNLVLGFLTSTSENLMLDTPLAKGFKLTDGNVTITVPSVVTRDNYIVVLMGSSGNASPKFVIQGTNRTGTSSVESSSVSTPITNPIPITGSTITGGSTTVTSGSATTTTLSTISSVSGVGSSSVSSLASSSASTSSSSLAATSSSGAGQSSSLHMYYTAVILAVLALNLTL